MTDRGKRILIVEDDEPTVQLVRHHLLGAQMLLEAAETAEAGMARYEGARGDQWPYSLILIDGKLPGHSGLWLGEQIRQRGDSETRLVFFTGYAEGPTLRERAHAVQAEIWAKPNNDHEWKEIIARIRRIVE